MHVAETLRMTDPGDFLHFSLVVGPVHLYIGAGDPAGGRCEGGKIRHAGPLYFELGHRWPGYIML